MERLANLLMVLGERLELGSVPVHPVEHRADRLTPVERLGEAASWNLVATQLEIAGATARREGHPATRRERS